MRSLISGSMRARRGVIAAAAVILAFGVWQLRDADLDSLPEFTPDRRRGPDRGARPVGGGDGAAHHRPAGAGPAERRGLDGVHPLAVGPRPVVDRHGVRARHRPLPRPPGRAGAPQRGPRACPNVAKVPAMLQPQSSTSRAMMISLSSEELTPIQLGVLARWTIVPRLTGVPGRVQRRDLGSEGAPAPGPRRSRAVGPRRRHPRPGHQHDRQRAVGVAAHLPRGVDAGHGRVHRPEQPAARRAAPLADQDGRRAGPGRHRGLRRARRHRRLRAAPPAPGGCGRRGRGPPGADRRRGRQRGRRPDPGGGEAARHEHDRGHRGGRGCARVDGGRPRRRRRRHRHLPAGDLPRGRGRATSSARS